MPAKSPQNHELIWVDLLKEVGAISWLDALVLLYSKNHGFSNYKKCKQRTHTAIRSEVLQDEKVKDFLGENWGNEEKVQRVLDEMCHLLDIQCNPTRKLKVAGLPFLKCITKIYSSIYVNSHLFPLTGNEKLGVDLFKEQYQKMSHDLPIVILPTHRSYMDFLFITYIMFINELPLPIVAAGDNFKAMGKILTNLFIKGAGAFLIRRNANNKKDIEASDYYNILRAYIHSILGGGENPLEFFMEGTRTRSGQVLRPKTGLLSMVVDMFINRSVEDVYILPVSINYQRPIEEQLYIAEVCPQIGMKKPKENAKNLLTAMDRIVKRNYGKVYVRFCEPFKLSDYYETWKRTIVNENDWNEKQSILFEFTNNLASRVCLAQAYNNILMPFNLLTSSALARSFLEKPINRKQNGHNVEVKENVRIPFSYLVEDFYALEELLIKTQSQFIPGWRYHREIFDEFKLNRDGIIRYSEDRKHIEFDYNALTFQTMLYYSNQLTQMLLPIAICSLLTLTKKNFENSDTQWEQYKQIRGLLSKEFLMDNLSLEKEYKESISALENNQVSSLSKSILLKHLTYFIQCYAIFLQHLSVEEVFDKNEFLQETSRASLSSERSPFISKDMLKNMIDLVKEMEICVVVEEKQTTTIKRNDEKLKVMSYEKLSKLRDQYQQVLVMFPNVLRIVRI